MEFTRHDMSPVNREMIKEISSYKDQMMCELENEILRQKYNQVEITKYTSFTDFC